ncbi:MAG TPA: RNA polymerase factor sigma-54 [Thermoanaerobaculia bacterium]|nr:RNA polymerase factor sigma-54 [Thermoanaerobaculia bacterium]HUM29963.1 RNA polymerase factor sigma-54 [Thermoanaerobaculia bacterium]HXK68170.1 RNA polymerase factor sigma-54 [Thermoanaerobaculia bacterium]
MALQSKLEQRLVQKLILTPTLQQAIKLLQLTRLELRDLMATELQTNPVLEDILGTEGEPPPQTTEKDSSQPEDIREEPMDTDIEAFFQDYLDNADRTTFTATMEPLEAAPIENISRESQKLVDYLLWQVQLMNIPPELIGPVHILIASLDDDGYLLDPLEDIAAESGMDMELLESALRVIHSLDPTGVGARSHQECLMMQTEDPVIKKVIQNQWDSFLHQDYETIRHALGLNEEEMDAVRETIRHLDLYPGRKYSNVIPVYVEPEVYVIRRGVHYTVFLNDDGMPRLRINRRYLRLFREANTAKDEETASYLRKKLQSALWLLKSVEQRHRTLYRVATSIVQYQRNFLDKGKDHLRPLTLRTVAEDVHVHESTVSRVVSNKYIQTPRGLFPMRMFFLQGLPTTDGSNVTVSRVQKIIQEVIEREDERKPLSDAKVAQIIQTRYHIRLARRTVAKYREELGIPSSQDRKKSRS